jgi:hypothetical protein
MKAQQYERQSNDDSANICSVTQPKRGIKNTYSEHYKGNQRWTSVCNHAELLSSNFNSLATVLTHVKEPQGDLRM